MPLPIFMAIAAFFKWAFTASSMAAIATKTAIMMAASYALNAALAPTVRDPKRSDAVPIGPQTTGEQGGAIQMHYGTNRIQANIVAHYTNVDILRDVYLLRTTVTRHILACFGEGPIGTLDLTTLRINGRPLSDVETMACEYTRGLVEQDALTGWETFRQDYNVGQTCVYDQAITYTLNTTGWTSLQVHIAWPDGFVRYNDDGAHHTSVGLKIEVGDAIADSWHTIRDGLEYGKSTNPVRCVYDADGSYTGGTPFTVTAGMRPRVRVTRTTPVPEASRYITAMEFAAVQVEREIAFEHPGMVMMSLSGVPKELTAGGVNELSVECDGRLVDDGEGAFAATHCHAEIVRDILTQPVIEGDGSVEDPYSATYYRGIDPDNLVGSGWSGQKTLAETPAPNGLGGTEDLCRCDIVFANSTSVHNAVGNVCATGRCGLEYRGMDFGLWLDAPRLPVGLLCDGTWERGSATLVPVPHDQLAAEASVRFRDGAAGYVDRSIHLIDHDFDSITEMALDLQGVTRTSEAARLARRELARNRLTDLSLTCRTDVYGAVYESGDVCYAQIDGRSLGGRITAVDGRTVTLDRDITSVVTSDDVIVIQVRDPVTGVQSVEMHAVDSVDSATEVTIDEDWDQAPEPGTPYLFGPVAIEDDQFEVVGMALVDHLFADLSLVRYVPALDDLDDLAPGVRVPLPAVAAADRFGGIRRRETAPATGDFIGGNTSALVGDGTTDNTAALQELIDDAILNGSQLALPKGIFLIEDTLTIGDGLTVVSGFVLRGAGWEQTKILWGGDEDANMIELLSASGVALENIWLDGDDTPGVTGIYHTTAETIPSQMTSLTQCGIVNCPAVGYHVKQWSASAACDYLSFTNCVLGYNGENLKVEGGVRQVEIYGGSNLNAATYGIHVVDGRVSIYDGLFALNGYDFVEEEQVGCDIYLSGEIAQIQVFGASSESLVFLDGDWANDAGWSRLLSCNAIHNLNQAPHGDLGGAVAVDVTINYDCPRPLILTGCKVMGDIALGSKCTSIQSIHTDFYNYERASDDADPITGFTGAGAAKVNIIGRTDNSEGTGEGSLTSTTILGGGRLLVVEDGWLKGIDLLDDAGTVYRRMGFSDGIPDTYYARQGWIVFAVNPTEAGALGWVCTVAGTPTTVKATFKAFGTNLIGATVTDFCRNNVLTAEDGEDLIAAAGFGTIASQDADDVTITGGSVSGITDLAVADGGTGASTAAGAASNLGLGTEDSPEFTAVNIGHASDTTITRVSAGNLAVEGNAIYRAGGTDVPVTDGGTGASTAADARTNLGVGSIATLADAVTAKSADYTVQSTDSGKWFTNTGASASTALTLPTAAAGLVYGVIRAASQAFWIKPASGEQFRGQVANKYLELTSDGMTVVVKCNATGIWDIVAAGVGTTAWMGP